MENDLADALSRLQFDRFWVHNPLADQFMTTWWHVSLIFVMFVAGLNQVDQQLMLDGLRLSTKLTYSSAQQGFIHFCHQFSLSPVPTNEHSILWYLAFTQSSPRSRSLWASSLRVHLSAIRSLHILSGYPLPPTTTPRLIWY